MSAAEIPERRGNSDGAGRRPRRTRSIQESLLSVALAIEGVLLIFVALTANGLKTLPTATALGGGAAFIVVIFVVTALLRYRAAVAVGWVIQVALIATGFLLPVMFGVGALFAGIWIYCFVKARQLERAQPLEGTP